MRSYGQYCAVAKALDVVGDRWNLLIVRELLLRGPSRYTDLLHGLPGIATNLLTDRLRDLEGAGIVRRRAAPPPVATTLFELSEAGEELRPALTALGRWGTRFMAEPAGDEAFRAHWLALPVSLYLADPAPGDPPASIEIRAGEEAEAFAIETVDGHLRTRVGAAAHPDLVLTGPPPLVLGVLSGKLGLTDARGLGLEATGDDSVLARLRARTAPQG